MSHLTHIAHRILVKVVGISALFVLALQSAYAQNCLEVSLTGTLGGPAFYQDLAGAGTLVKYGSVESGCSDTNLQFDVGRATGMRLSQLGVSANQVDAVFITHLHSDHTWSN